MSSIINKIKSAVHSDGNNQTGSGAPEGTQGMQDTQGVHGGRSAGHGEYGMGSGAGMGNSGLTGTSGGEYAGAGAGGNQSSGVGRNDFGDRNTGMTGGEYAGRGGNEFSGSGGNESSGAARNEFAGAGGSNFGDRRGEYAGRGGREFAGTGGSAFVGAGGNEFGDRNTNPDWTGVPTLPGTGSGPTSNMRAGESGYGDAPNQSMGGTYESSGQRGWGANEAGNAGTGMGAGNAGMGTTTGTSGLGASGGAPGPAHGTAGPHRSNLANKMDPRVDSNMDGSRTMGGNNYQQTGTGPGAGAGARGETIPSRDPRDAAQVPPSVMQRHVGEPVLEHDDVHHGRARRNSVQTHQEAHRGI